MSAIRVRPRIIPLLACLLAVLACLGYDRFRPDLPAWWREHGGGIPYVVFWVLLWGTTLASRKLVLPIAGYCTLFTCGLEFLQLWQPQFLSPVRSTRIGAALLGSTFAWGDFPAYFVGGLVGYLVLKGIMGSPDDSIASDIEEPIVPRQRPRRRKRHRANWPYRFAWLLMIGAVLTYVAIGTWISSMHELRFHAIPDLYAAFVARCLDATFGVWFFAVGASIGSFLNVVAYRLPLGRTLGGHSGCPYCCSPIAGSDNIPVLAWLKLRGRCRTCHLPISSQYPLVELMVGLVFLSVFLTEFARAGGNLPGNVAHGHGYGVAWTNVSLVMAARTFAYLFVVSGLIGAALIAIKQRPVPMQLYLWLIVPWTVGAVAMPGLIVVPWWTQYRRLSDLDARLDSIVTIVCGLVAGIAVARIVAPLIYGHVDRTLASSDRATSSARQWIGALGVAGAMLGWQTACQIAIAALICQLACLLVLSKRQMPIDISDSTAWVWLGLILVRAIWGQVVDWKFLDLDFSPVLMHLTALVCVAALGAGIGKIVHRPPIDDLPTSSPEPQDSDNDAETDPPSGKDAELELPQ